MTPGGLRRFVGRRHPGMMMRMAFTLDTRRLMSIGVMSMLHAILVRRHM